MPGRIVADPRTLNGYAGELATVSTQFEQEAYQLRAKLGFLINRPDIPNGAALMSSYMTALQSLDNAAATSRQLSGGVTRYAQRVVDCENALLRSGDGPSARPWGGGGGGRDALGWLGKGFGFAWKGYGVFDGIAALTAPWSIRQIGLHALRTADVDTLAAMTGIKKATAQKIVDARMAGRRFGDIDDLGRLGLGKYKPGAATGALQKYALAQRIALAQRLSGLGRVGTLVNTLGGGLQGKLAPFARGISRLGKVVAPVAFLDSAVTLKKQWTDDGYNDPNMLGGDRIEDGMAGAGFIVAGAGTAAAFGLVANPVGLVVIGGAGLAVGAYYAAPYVWKGGKWVAGKIGDGVGYVGGKIGDGVGYVGDRIGDARDVAVGAARDKIEDAGRAAGAVKDAVSDKADDVKDAVSDKADDVKDAVGSKLGGAKDAVSKKFGGLF